MLSGQLVELRAPTDDDETLLYRIASDLDTWEERSPRSPMPTTLAAYRRARAENDDDASVEFVITAGGNTVGRCTLFHEDPLSRHAEVGIALLRDSRGKGYGTDALGVLAEFGFLRRNLRRLYLSVIASNTAAITSYRTLGFVEEGRLREHCWVRGAYEDELTMGLLRSAWQTARE